MTTLIHFDSGSPHGPQRYPAAVSLHSHTLFSRENLSFFGAWLRSTPLAAKLSCPHRRDLLLSRLWWTPPLPPGEVFRLEAHQIEQALDARPLVSITDHDEIAACRSVQLLHGVEATPISLEWTVPLGPSFVHLGVHSLPPARAEAMFGAMREYTAAPDEARLPELLAWIGEDRATLVVLNHPLWDEAHIGAAAHLRMVRALLARSPGAIHALELNGLRPPAENSASLALAQDIGLPAVSGGDRHGARPSACLNLTHARSFAEFAAEVRFERRSTILLLPLYSQSHRLRQFDAVWELVRDYPEYPDRGRWTDRTFINDEEGNSRSLSEIWSEGEPWPVRAGFQALRFGSLGWRAARWRRRFRLPAVTSDYR
jgi:hypothetical protein